MFCSDHEYCGVDNSGAPACLCRAVFASKYTTNNTFGKKKTLSVATERLFTVEYGLMMFTLFSGEPTVCDGNSATLSLFNCLLTEKGMSYSNLHLRDPSCKGQMDPVTHTVTFEFNSTNTCGTVLTVSLSFTVQRRLIKKSVATLTAVYGPQKENNKVYLKNSIQSENVTGMVVRHDQFDLEFSCSYDQPEIKNVVLKIKDR